MKQSLSRLLILLSAPCLAVLFTGCTTDAGRDPSVNAWEQQGPFAVRLNQTVKWTRGKPEGFDPDLPGYHLSGGVVSFPMAPAGNQPPERFILAITTPGRDNHLDLFRMNFSGVSIECEPFNPKMPTRIIATNRKSNLNKTVEPGTFFDFKVREKDILVIFKPALISSLRGKCSVFWIDRHRN